MDKSNTREGSMKILQETSVYLSFGAGDKIELSHLDHALLTHIFGQERIFNTILLVSFEDGELGEGIGAGIAGIWAFKKET